MSDITAIYDLTTEFAADKLTISTTKSTVGLTRWGKDYMISFFPLDIRGNRLKYESGIDIVYDLFLTNEQVEAIVDKYNKDNGIIQNRMGNSLTGSPYLSSSLLKRRMLLKRMEIQIEENVARNFGYDPSDIWHDELLDRRNNLSLIVSKTDPEWWAIYDQYRHNENCKELMIFDPTNKKK